MSEEFRASNGIRLKRIRDGLSSDSDGLIGVDGEFIRAIGEWVDRDRNEAIGRWRYDDDLLVYPGEGPLVGLGRHARVLDEKEGKFHDRHEFGQYETGDYAWMAAFAYFQAHPVPGPADGAKPGEVWEIDLDGGRRTLGFVDTDGDFAVVDTDGVIGNEYIYRNKPSDMALIRDARRVYPNGGTE